MLLNALDRLKLDPFIGMLNLEDFVTLNLRVSLTYEVYRLPTQLRQYVVNSVFTWVMTEDFNLQVKMAFLMVLEPGSRILA